VLPILERVRSDLAARSSCRNDRAARLEDRLGEAVPELYDAEANAVTAHRCRESAIAFWRSGDEPAARACLAAAREFASAKPADNAVARALVERVLRPAFEGLVRDAEGAAAKAG
jgi:hypothetical protein